MVKKSILFSLPAVILAAVLMVSTPVEASYKTVTRDKNDDYIETQTAYKPVSTIEKIGDEFLSGPKDMVIFENRIYIADTGNGRVVVASPSGELVRSFGSGYLKEPVGIFVSKDGGVFVADSGANAVFCFTQEGELERKYERPTDLLYGDKENFIPQKIAVDGKDNLYVVCKGNSNGVVQFSRSSGEFLGYFGANDVSVALWDKILDAIFTDEQKEQLLQTTPASISNITVDEKGIVYTLTDIKTHQVVRKLNMSGNDMLDQNISFGNPSDLCVGNIGNIYASTTNGYILEFNSEGNLLFVFGGFDDGSQRIGLFSSISSVAVDSDGVLYVLDDITGQIQAFESTEFTDYVHSALLLYQEGKYLESKEPWEQVLLMNNLFDYAHKGIAEAYYMEEDYAAAMEHFRLSNDRKGYSKAFKEQRNINIRKNLFLYLGIVLVAGAALYVCLRVRKRRKAADTVYQYKNGLGHQICFLFQMVKNPADAYYGIKRERRASPLSATFWYAVFVLIYFVDKYGRGYIFSTVTDGQYYLIKDFGAVACVIALLVLCHYLICSITEGEASLSNVYCGAIYSMMPYIVLRPIVIILTHVLSRDEVFLINMVNFVIYAGCVALLVIMVYQLNNYKVSETVKCIFWTLFAVFVAIVVMFILYIMSKQAAGFVQEVISEVIYDVRN